MGKNERTRLPTSLAGGRSDSERHFFRFKGRRNIPTLGETLSFGLDSRRGLSAGSDTFSQRSKKERNPKL